jgi:hypothetical protein
MLAISREATRRVIEWSDDGPHAVFADVAEGTVMIQVVMEIAEGDIEEIKPGTQGILSAVTSPGASDAARRKLSARCVLMKSSHELSLKRGAVRTLEFVALSEDGAADPISVEDAGGAR